MKSKTVERLMDSTPQHIKDQVDLFADNLVNKQIESDIKPTDKVCANCTYLLRMIAIGQGIRCGYNKQEGKLPSLLPSFKHTCENFKYKNDEKS